MATISGALYLVSVGIGDIDNMTIKAQKIIKQADIIFAMQFVREQVSELLDGKEIYDAGHGLFTGLDFNSGTPADEDKARAIIRNGFKAGKTIAILDFGDPTIYSPQSGYMKEFSDLGPKIVPGISSFNAANALLGKELTTLSFDRAIILTEAMTDWNGSQERLKRAAATRGTLVFFAMRLDLEQVTKELMQYYPADTPVAIVANAGFSGQEKIIRGSLQTIYTQTEEEQLPWQHLIYVGDFLK